MNNLRIKQALHYQLDYMLKAALWVLGIIGAIIIILSVIVQVAVSGEAGNYVADLGFTNFSIGPVASFTFFNIGAIITIMLFITGISGIREDLKFFLQHGIGRKTTFLSTLFTSLASGIVLGLICEIATMISDRFPMTIASGLGFVSTGFFGGWLLHTLTFFFAWQLGALISLIYYRLGKYQKVIFSVAAIALIMFGLRVSITHLVNFLIPYFPGLELTYASVRELITPLGTALITFVLGALTSVGNYLLLRRAPAKEC